MNIYINKKTICTKENPLRKFNNIIALQTLVHEQVEWLTWQRKLLHQLWGTCNIGSSHEASGSDVQSYHRYTKYSPCIRGSFKSSTRSCMQNLRLKDLFSLTSSGGASIKNLQLKNLILLILKFIKLIKIYTNCSRIHIKPKIKNDKESAALPRLLKSSKVCDSQGYVPFTLTNLRP